MAVKRAFHINVNCTDFERSLEFYRWLGFEIVNDLGEGGNRGIQQGLGMSERPVGRAALLQAVGDDPRGLRIDLIEWKKPRVEGRAYPHLWHAGLARLALLCDNLLELCEQAAERGVELVSAPVIVENPNGTTDGWVCLYDPDGTVIELIQFKNAAA
ncbi:MAG: VOC family protein [Acidimicrobiales bacterium]